MATEEKRRIKTYVGATARKLRFQIRSSGLALDLSSVVAATVSGRFSREDSYKIQAETINIEAGTDGWCYFYPTSGAIDTAGDLISQIRLEYTSDLDYSDKFIIEVLEPEFYE